MPNALGTMVVTIPYFVRARFLSDCYPAKNSRLLMAKILHKEVP